VSVKLMAMVFEAEFPKYLVYTTREGREKRLKRSTAKLVLLAFADHANDDGRGAYPSLDLVASKTGLSLRAVKNTVLALVYVGLLIPNGKSFRGTNDYIVNKDALAHGVVNPVHPDDDGNAQGGEPGSPGGVNPVHSRGEPGSPEPSFNRPFNHPPNGGASAPRSPEASVNHQKGKRSRRSRKSKKVVPPAVQVYRSYAGLFPKGTLWKMLSEAVGDNERNLRFWGNVVEAWVASGWNPRNIRGMLEYFQRREIPGTRLGQRGAFQTRQSTSDDNTDDAFAVVAQARELLEAGESEAAAQLLAEKIFDARANPPIKAVFEARKIWNAIYKRPAKERVA